jgi:hypothetical protein
MGGLGNDLCPRPKRQRVRVNSLFGEHLHDASSNELLFRSAGTVLSSSFIALPGCPRLSLQDVRSRVECLASDDSEVLSLYVARQGRLEGPIPLSVSPVRFPSPPGRRRPRHCDGTHTPVEHGGSFRVMSLCRRTKRTRQTAVGSAGKANGAASFTVRGMDGKPWTMRAQRDTSR